MPEKTAKRKKEVKNNRKKWKISLIVIGVLIAAVLVGGYAVFHHYFSMMRRGEDSMEILDSIPEEPEDSVREEESRGSSEGPEESGGTAADVMINWKSYEGNVYEDPDTYNMLLIGVDSRESDMRGRSDAMIIASVNEKTRQITLTSIMRDTFVYIPEVGYNRINVAAAYGGAPLLIRTLEANFNIHIDHYMITNFEVFTETIERMGGVDMEITGEEARYINKELHGEEIYRQPESETSEGEESELSPDDKAIAAGYLPADGGYLHLNGVQTLTYCRCRAVGNSDFGRTERQRKTLLVLAEKAKQMSIGDINGIATTLLPKMTTNLSQGYCLSLLFKAVTDYKNYEIQTLRIPADGTLEGVYVEGMAVLSVDFEKNIDLFFSKVYNR